MLSLIKETKESKEVIERVYTPKFADLERFLNVAKEYEIQGTKVSVIVTYLEYIADDCEYVDITLYRYGQLTVLCPNLLYEVSYIFCSTSLEKAKTILDLFAWEYYTYEECGYKKCPSCGFYHLEEKSECSTCNNLLKLGFKIIESKVTVDNSVDFE